LQGLHACNHFAIHCFPYLYVADTLSSKPLPKCRIHGSLIAGNTAIINQFLKYIWKSTHMITRFCFKRYSKMDFIKVASLSELPEGCSKIVRVNNSKGSVSFQRKITAIGNACLHKGTTRLGCIEKKYGAM
jgi:hypothetical protein